jgi:hypothetical protein
MTITTRRIVLVLQGSSRFRSVRIVQFFEVQFLKVRQVRFFRVRFLDVPGAPRRTQLN